MNSALLQLTEKSQELRYSEQAVLCCLRINGYWVLTAIPEFVLHICQEMQQDTGREQDARKNPGLTIAYLTNCDC
jgi:hypothetical protein